jgi:septal ring factor EnvC (AmiA/AmiB activator)
LFIPDNGFSSKNTPAQIDSMINNRKAELDKIQVQLKQKQDRLGSLEKEEKSQLDILADIEEKLSLDNQLIAKINRQIVDMNSRLGILEQQHNTNQDDLARHKRIMDDRLVWIYKRSRFSPLYSAVGAGDLLQGARQIYYFSLLNRYDRNILAQIGQLSGQVEKDRDALQKRQVAILELKDGKQAQLENIQKDQKKRKDMLSRVRLQKKAQQQSITDLLATQKKISGILEDLSIKKKSLKNEQMTGFARLKGNLSWPAEGKIVQGFGKVVDKRYSTAVFNAGIDIAVGAGTAVKATLIGEVAYISWLRGYGSFIIVDHGDSYYSLYAHLEEIEVEVGQQVTAGENLGTVGDSGTLSGPQLHFELRRGQEQLDPSEWLR